MSLHDVGHAPFSHTFEAYFGRKKDLANELTELVNSKTFKKDLESSYQNPAFHEYTSSILCMSVFSDSIEELGGDIELVVRMIIGCWYSSNTKQIENCFISLLHGDVIDADRLDYACRDVWASGYCTSTFDLKRLISAIHIKQNKKKDWVVCFDSNVVNEIESVINVKDFQVTYVINHHSVVYDQWLLTKAAEYCAIKLYPQEEAINHTGEEDIEDKGTKALYQLCNIEHLINSSKETPYGAIKNLSDGDLIYLMKQDESNKFFQEWYGRQYEMFPLWKSREDFYHDFPFISCNTDLYASEYNSEVKKAITETITDISEDDIFVKKITYKARVKLSSLYLSIREDVMRYTDLYKDIQSKPDLRFYYIYINKKGMGETEIENIRRKATEALTPLFKSFYLTPSSTE